MDHVLLVVGRVEYRLKITTAAAEDAEKRLGCSLMDALGQIDRAASFVTILWAGLQKYHHGMTIQRVYDLVDSIIEQGCVVDGKAFEGAGLEVRALIAMEVFKVSGFFTKEQIELMEETAPIQLDTTA